MKAVGLTTGEGCDLRITQTEPADAVGLSIVNVNRSLQVLREQGLVIFKKKRLVVTDMELCRSCGFRPNYLHLSGVVPTG